MIVMSCVFVGSILPTLSRARYFTVAVAETVNGPLYAVLESVGSEPSSVYRMTETPLSLSVALSETVTAEEYAELEHVEPLHEIDDVGAVVSIWIVCVFVSSAFPALSQARYLIVVGVETVKGAV